MKRSRKELMEGVVRFFRKNSRILLLCAAALGGVLLIAGALGGDSKTAEAAPEEALEEMRAELEKQIGQLLSGMEGVGRCEVMITFEDNGRTYYAADTKTTVDLTEQEGKTDSKTSAQTDYVTVNSSGKSQLAVLRQTCPEIRGVAILCDGGASARVRTEVADLVGTLLGIPGGKIAVSQRKSR